MSEPKWTQVEDGLPELSIEWEDEDENEFSSSLDVLVAYANPYAADILKYTGETAKAALVTVAWYAWDEKWYHGDPERPSVLQGVLAWAPLPTYKALKPQILAEPPC